MKKFLSILMLCALSWVAVAQTTLTKPQAMKALMAKEHLRNTLQAKKQPAAAKAPTQLADLDTTEVYFTSFYEKDHPYFIEPDNWFFTLHNERYQFNFSIIKKTNPQTMAGTYTEKDLEEDFSWCMFPEANGKTHYYKTCELTIQEEKVSANLTRYIVDAVVLATCGIGGPEYGYFKIHAEHQIITPTSKLDVALYNCSINPEEDRWSIAGKDNEIEVDLTFFTETGIEGYYSHKLMDEENSKIVHKGQEKGIMELEGIIYGAENKSGGLTYVFMFEALTNDTCFYNVAMEAPVVAKDTIEITSNNTIINDAYGMTDKTILVDASTGEYEINAAYNASKITTPAEYPTGTTGSSYVYLTDLKTGQQIESIVGNLKITGNETDGYQVEIRMLGTDYNYYIMHLSYGVPNVKETKVLDFKNNSKTMYYILDPYLPELQMANFDGEYSVSFDILYINQVMGGEFDMTNMLEEQTFLIHHINNNGDKYDSPVRFAEFGGKIWQENDTTFLTASILGFDSIQYEISMFYAVPTPTETVKYDFNGLGDDVVDLTNAVTSGIFILDAMSADGQLMAKVNVERITTKSIEGTFYNDGKFDHNDFYPIDTWVKVYNATTKAYDEYSVQKGTMTVKVENDIVTAVASFICDNAVQYDLTFITKYTREHIALDCEDCDPVDYTYTSDSHYEFTTDYVESHNQLYFDIFAPDYSNVTAMVFFVDHVDSDITIPEGVYPINSSKALGTVYASPGMAVGGGPIQSYFSYTYVEGEYLYFVEDGGLFLVDGTVTVKKNNGKLSFEVDAVNSYDVPVKLYYNVDGTAVENITTDHTNNVVKRLVDGQLLIIRNGKAYNATGALIK